MGERRGTKALELWCRRMCEGYPGVKIDNMTTSWRDGLAFCAIIHHFRPDLIDFSKLDKNDIYTNNELAFRVAESHLGIPALLEPEDMVEYPVPDRLSILTYLSQFYQTFVTQSNSPSKTPPKRPPPADLQMHISSTSSSPPKKPALRTSFIQREPCFKCDLPVFIAERLNVGKSLYHRTCFRCARCGSQLAPTNYYETENNEYCCETCPDEEIATKINPNILNKSLSDEEKSASLKGEFDIYSNDFENLLECPRDASLKRNFTLDRQLGGQFAKARSEFMTTQVVSSSSETDSDSGSENKKSEISVDQHSENINAISSDLLPSLSDIGTSSFKLSKKDQFASEEKLHESQDSVTKSNPVVDEPIASSIKSRIKLFEGDTEDCSVISESDVNIKIKISEHNVPSLENENEEVEEIDSIVSASQVDDSVSSENYQADISEVDKSKQTNESTEIKSEDLPDNNSVIEISSGITEEDSVVIISDSSEPQSKNADSSSPQYPEDLNPFDDDGEVEVKENIPEGKSISLNPFGDSDDEEEPKKPQPAPRLIKPPESLNPFGSDDEDEEIDDLPQPSQRKLLKAPRFTLTPIGDDELKPKPLPRSPRSAASKTSDTSSLSGSARKKKPAPKPPTAASIFSQDSNESPLGSVTSSPSHSVCHSPKTTPKFRKVRRAPLPPVASTPLAPGKSDYAINDSIKMEESPSPLQFRVGSEENLKNAKDEMNRNTQLSLSSNDGPSSLPNKSTYGKWKRRKGQAPPRPLPQKRCIKNLPINEIKEELQLIEVQQLGLEKQGVQLEKIIRERSETAGAEQDETLPTEVEDMILQLFEIVNEKNELFRRQTELMYLRRQHRLEEEHAEVEYQIRCLMLQPEANKTDSDKTREEELIKRLMEIVESRNEIVDCLEMNRQREADEDTSINSQLNLFTQKREDDSTKKNSNKKEKDKRKKNKEKKSKSKSKVDADKDVDESEVPVSKEKKKKKKFSLF